VLASGPASLLTSSRAMFFFVAFMLSRNVLTYNIPNSANFVSSGNKGSRKLVSLNIASLLEL
jgi:hypothetical protein